jgi:hypothetical protein
VTEIASSLSKAPLFPEVVLVVLDLVRLQGRQEFFLKRDLPVVSFLSSNIKTHSFGLRFAYRERVSILPVEARSRGKVS